MNLQEFDSTIVAILNDKDCQIDPEKIDELVLRVAIRTSMGVVIHDVICLAENLAEPNELTLFCYDPSVNFKGDQSMNGAGELIEAAGQLQ